ncbi:MAG TPA: FAD-dependent oxidoreductase [Solirubrobacteraceae bacterium]|nr:FAD-dependent oxidoreductase [Solirubrobacteraceae bacterium]
MLVIGAGPHGLAATAHLRAAGVPTRVFGEALSFWRETMPPEMFLRSSPRASNISDPGGELSLARWADHNSRKIGSLVPIGDFIDYGEWFQAQAAPDLDRRQVTRVERRSDELVVTLSDGEQLSASRVVVAVGLGRFAHVPPVFASLPASHATHAAQCPDLARFAGRSVAVIGSGQTALESAAILGEAGAKVEVIARAPRIFWLGGYGWGGVDGRPVLPPPPPSGGTPAPPSWRARRGLYWHEAPTEVGGRYTGWIGAAPDVCRRLPRVVRGPLTEHCIRPAGGYWLPNRLREVTITLGRSTVEALPLDDQVALRLDDGGERIVDHVLLGTGYRIDVGRFSFLAPDVLAGLKTKGGSPVLTRGLESSIAGLHFTGALAAESFGPAMRFVVGTAYTAPALAQGALGRRRPLFRWAF